MKHNYLFATLISEFKYVPDDNLLNAIKNEEMKEKPISFHSISSLDNKLHKKNEYQPLVKTILNNTKEICKMYEYEYEKIEITNMWINCSKKADMHAPHSHSNNIFSGVWYPFSNSQTSIYFYDPRAVANFWLPNKKENNIINSSGWSMPNKQNLGLIFPSWLYHSVPPADGERISLSWNIILRGEYGEPNTLQNAHI